MNIFGFTGLPWSGKSEAVKIAKKKGLAVFRMGDFVWDEVKKRNLSLNTNNVGKIAQEMREKHGNTIWAEKTVNAIKQSVQSSDVVIDGIRSVDEINYFRKHLSNSFRLVAIIATDKLRHERAKLRKRADDSTNNMDLQNRDDREKKWGIDRVINSADVVISNQSSLESFREKVNALFSD